MRYMLKLLIVVGKITLVASGLQGQDVQPPIVTLHGNKVEFYGKYTNIGGYLPQKSEAWYYLVEQQKTHLFIYHFWVIAEFQDRKEPNGGFFRAKSWNVQVLDSSDDPEKQVIFDKENDFYFWGNFTIKENQVRIEITSIEGFPPSLYGPVLLRKLN